MSDAASSRARGSRPARASEHRPAQRGGAERSRRPGFTLLEVLAAVAVLGLTVAMLARGAIQGMRYEGDAARRLAASLIADRALFEVESALALGALPEPGRQEREDGDFRITVDVAPLEPAALGLAALLSPPAATPGAAPPPPPQQLPKFLLVTVQVAWVEGLLEQDVTRTTFAYDATEAAQLLGAAEAASEAAEREPEAPPDEQPPPGAEEP